MNGEIRDREKVLRGLKKDDSAILSGYQLFHNYVKPVKAWIEKLRRKPVAQKSKDKTSGKLTENASKKD